MKPPLEKGHFGDNMHVCEHEYALCVDVHVCVCVWSMNACEECLCVYIHVCVCIFMCEYLYVVCVCVCGA